MGTSIRSKTTLDLEELELEVILVTHGHFDHAGAAADLSSRRNARIEGPHRNDQKLILGLRDQPRRYNTSYSGTSEPYDPARWLASIPGAGPVTATALAASVTEPSMFASGREFSAFMGLVPRQNSSGGKTRLGRTSKMGDRYLRTLLVCGATALLSPTRRRSCALDVWAKTLSEKKKPTKLIALALANKMARIAWALMARGETFRVPALAA